MGIFFWYVWIYFIFCNSTALGNIDIKLFSSCHSLHLPCVFCLYYISAAYRKAEQWKIQPEIFQCFPHCFQIQFKQRMSIPKALNICTPWTLVTTCSLVFTQFLSRIKPYAWSWNCLKQCIFRKGFLTLLFTFLSPKVCQKVSLFFFPKLQIWR